MHTLNYDKLTVYEVESLKKELLPLLESSENEIVLDMSGIQKIDMAAIQLLIAAMKSAREKSKKFSLYGLTSNVSQALQLCGCSDVAGAGHE